MRKLLSYLFLSLLFVSQIKAQDNNFDIDSLRRIGLPVIIVNTVNQEFPTCDYVTSPEGSFGQSITNNNKVACQIIIIQEQDTLYNSGEYKKGSSGATIKINGNTSAYWFDNKPYKIKLEKKADLLLRHDDKYEDKEWRLIRDGYTLNTIIGFKLSELIGMPWTPQYQPCNVVINNDYQGCYLLIESVKRNPDCRLNVDKDNGFIIERDAYWWNEEKYFCTNFFSQNNYYRWTWKHPDEKDFTTEQENYIREYINQAEQSIFDGTYDHYIDVNTFAWWVLAHDILCSHDAGGCNMYVTKYDQTDQTLLQMGNLWDFDSSYGMEKGQFSRIHTSNYDFYYDNLFNNENKLFVKAYKKKWNEIKHTLNDQLYDFISSFKSSELGEKLQKSWDCQSKRWDTDIVSISNSADASIDWFNSHLPLLGQNIELIDDTDTGIKSYHTHQQNNTPIYTIYGQRVHHTKKGIYIQNGKKIIIK